MALGRVDSSGAAGQNPSVLCWFLAGDHSQGFFVVVALFFFVCCGFFWPREPLQPIKLHQSVWVEKAIEIVC